MIKQVFKGLSLAFVSIVILSSCRQASGTQHLRIEPLPAGYSADSLTDCTFPALFRTSDFNWRGSSLTLKVYAETLYDAVDISRMAEGDTLVYDGRELIVKQLDESSGWIVVNGGIEEDGAELHPGDGGTYKAILLDDHPLYFFIGEARVMLDDDFVISDCGTEPFEPSTIVTTGQKAYMDMLPESRRLFSELDTRVHVENGLVKEIVRKWIP